MGENEIRQEVWSEGERARNELLDCYYEVVRCYPEYITKLKRFGKNDLSLYQRWRNNLHRAFLLIYNYERDKLKELDFTDRNASNLLWLERATHKIINLESFAKLTSLGKIIHDFDPIVQYRKENYGEDVGAG